MIEYWDYFNYGYDASGTTGQGMMTTLPVDDDRDIISELHAVVEEVTRIPVAPVNRAPMGFY